MAISNEAAHSDLAETAIAEIKAQMAARGEPKVWIEDWRDRYRGLGPSPKQFLESRPDVFRLQYFGTGYSVFLVEDGGPAGPAGPVGPAQESWKGGKGGRSSLDSEFGELGAPTERPSEQECVEEITRLVQQSADGRIWIPDWFRRFAHLAKSPRAFMESRPDLFALMFQGNTYSVSLVGAETPAQGQAPAGQPAAKRPAEALPLSGQATMPLPVWKMQKTEAPPAAIGGAAHNSNPRNWVGPGAAASPAASSPAPGSASALDYLGDKEEDALAEIFDQLSKPSSNGKVSFSDWAGRFGHLAPSPRAFIQNHSDKFEIIPGLSGGFTVELC